MKLQREGEKVQEGSLEIKASWQTISKAFDMSRATAKVSPKSLKEDDQVSNESQKITSRAALTEAILAIR